MMFNWACTSGLLYHAIGQDSSVYFELATSRKQMCSQIGRLLCQSKCDHLAASTVCMATCQRGQAESFRTLLISISMIIAVNAVCVDNDHQY